MTNEVGINRHISEFVSGGPKNYGYKDVSEPDGETVSTEMKIRGITLNYANSQLLNFDAVRRMVLSAAGIDVGGGESSITVHHPRKIQRPVPGRVVSKSQSKI